MVEAVNPTSRPNATNLDKDSRTRDVRRSNIEAAGRVAMLLNTCLGPVGRDKMLYTDKSNVTITNDGATIMDLMKLKHPIAKMMKELAQAQDKQAGDGTTSVIVFAGELLRQAQKLLEDNVHHSAIVEGFTKAKNLAMNHLDAIANHIDITKLEAVQQVAQVALNSKVVGSYDEVLAPMAVKAVMLVQNSCPAGRTASASDIKLIKKKGEMIEDCRLVDGIVFESGEQPSCKFGKVSKAQNANIALIQFQLSSAKPYTESNVVINNASQLEQIEIDEKEYIMNIINALKKANVNVLLIQKSILRDSTTKLSTSLLNEAKIMFVDNIDRSDMDYVSRKLGVKPIASVDHLTPENLAYADICQKVSVGYETVVEVTGIKKPQNQSDRSVYNDAIKPVSIILTASNDVLLDECERSMFDAISAVVCILKESKLVAGGGASEMSTALFIDEQSRSVSSIDHYIFKAFSEALKIIPSTLAENVGLNPLVSLIEMEKVLKEKGPGYGVSAKKHSIADMSLEDVVQPSHVTKSMINLATEFACSILKIDDIIVSR